MGNTATRREVYAALDGERDYQDEHTLQDNPAEPTFTTGDYITMMRHYVDKLATEWATNPGAAPASVLCAVRKIGAISVQCMEVHGVVTREAEWVGEWGKRSGQYRHMRAAARNRGEA